MYHVRAICQATSHTSFLHASSDSNSVPDQQLPMDVAPFVLLVSMHCVRAPIHPTMTQERRMSSRPLASVCLCIACWFVLAACFYHPGIGPGSAKQCIHEHLFLDPINQEKRCLPTAPGCSTALISTIATITSCPLHAGPDPCPLLGELP